MKEVYDFLKEAEVYYLATFDGKKPRVRPFGSLNIFEGKLYIETSNNKDVFKQIMDNPYVELCAVKGRDWIRVSGKLIRDERLEAKESMFNNNPILREYYKADSDKTEVLYIDQMEAVIYSFDRGPRNIKI